MLMFSLMGQQICEPCDKHALTLGSSDARRSRPTSAPQPWVTPRRATWSKQTMDQRLALSILIIHAALLERRQAGIGPDPDKVNPQPLNTRSRNWVTSPAAANMLGVCRRKIHAATKQQMERYRLMSRLRLPGI